MTEWLTTKEVSEKSGLTRDTLKTYLSNKTMPEPDHYFQRTPVWKEETINEWVSTRRKIKPVPSKEEGSEV
jgi:predicted DNA-binding transcriptional regulator AlpA